MVPAFYAVSLASILIFTSAPATARAAASSTEQTAPSIYSLVGTTTSIESSAPIEKKITSFSPKAGALAAPVLAAIDAGRIWIAALLQDQIRATAQKLPGNALVNPAKGKGFTDTNQIDLGKILQSIIGVLWTVYFYILILLRFVIAKVIFCYPILAAGVIFFAYRLLKRPQRPKWRRR